MNRKSRAILLMAILVIGAALLSACSVTAMWIGNNYPGNMEGSYKYFDGTKTENFKLNEGDTVSFTYESNVEKGSLSIVVQDPDGKNALELAPNEKGTEELKAAKAGKYKVIITGSKTNGSYSVKWKINK